MYKLLSKERKSPLSSLVTIIVGGSVFVCSLLSLPGANPTILAEETESVFTVAQVPDTQTEILSDDNPLLFNRYQWLANNREAINLKLIAQTGDLVNWGVVDPIQFARANSATAILDNMDIPFSYAIGNHDTAAVQVGGSAGPGNVRENLRNTTVFNQNFPLSRFKNVHGTFEANKVDNMYQTFVAGGMNWMILTHEMWPRASVVQWMKNVVATHPTHNVIVSTHAFIDNTGSLPTTGNYGDQNAQIVWNEFISQYSNIKLVISGHYGPKDGIGGYYYKEVTGSSGNKIVEVMTAYHSSYQNHVRLLSFDTVNSSISSLVYVNDSLDAAYPTGYITDWASNFTITNMNWVRPDGSGTQEPQQTSPSVPESVKAIPGVSEATISFTTPITNGGSPITGYTAVANPGGATASGLNSPLTIVGLNPGTTYTFTVMATNAIGNSPQSAPSNNVMVLDSNPELLPDAGFEFGNGGWTVFDAGTLSRVSSPVHGGTKALKVTRSKTTYTNTGITLNNVVTKSVAGTTYAAKCYVRATTSGINLTMRFLEYPQNYQPGATHFPTDVTISSLPANTWTTITVQATAIKSGERMIPQLYSTNQYKSAGSVIYDDCSLKVVQQ